jgi:hypothetical protein
MADVEVVGNISNVAQAVERGTLGRVNRVTVSEVAWRALSGAERDSFETWCDTHRITLRFDNTLDAGVTRVTRDDMPEQQSGEQAG